MIANLVKGRGFRGVLEYALQEHKGYMLDSNMAGENARELAKEYGAVRALHPTVANPVHHVSLSLAPGENFSDAQWREVTGRYLEDMGFTNNQYVSCRHTGRVGAIVRAVDERHAEINRRYGSKIGRTGKELPMDKNASLGDTQDMGLLPGEIGQQGRRDTGHTTGNGQIRANHAEENSRNPASAREQKQIATVDVPTPGGGDSLSALERIRAMADAGLRYSPKQSEHDLLQNRRVGETSAEPPVERDKMTEPERKAKNKSQDMEL